VVLVKSIASGTTGCGSDETLLISKFEVSFLVFPCENSYLWFQGFMKYISQDVVTSPVTAGFSQYYAVLLVLLTTCEKGLVFACKTDH